MASIFLGSKHDSTTLRLMMNEAQQAYHDLATGTKAVKIARDGRDVEFKQANMHDLRIYIQSLQKELGLIEGRSAPSGVRF